MSHLVACPTSIGQTLAELDLAEPAPPPVSSLILPIAAPALELDLAEPAPSLILAAPALELTPTPTQPSLPAVAWPSPDAPVRVYTYGRSMGAGTRRRLGGYAYTREPPDGGGGGEGDPLSGAMWTSAGRITNQLMELAAAFEGLQAVERHFDPAGGTCARGGIVLVTTSHYVTSCMTQWLPRWQRTGWITKQQRVVQNCDVLKRMADISGRFGVRFEHVESGVGAATTDAQQPQPPGLERAKAMVDDVLHDALHAGCSKRHDVMCVWGG